MSIPTRFAQLTDIPALRAIWAAAFGEGDEADFFSFYFKPETCVVADRDGSPVAAGYLVPFGDIVYSGADVPCAMIYAVAVLPDFRSLGYGKYLVRDLISAGHSMGYPAIVLCPSDDSLFEYYSARTDLRDWFYAAERRLSIVPPPDSIAELSRISADDYSELRERLLAGTPHIKLNRDVLLFQDIICSHEGGGLFRASTAAAPDGAACAIVERQPGGSVAIKELLALNGCESSALLSIAAKFPSDEYTVRTPAKTASIATEPTIEHTTEHIAECVTETAPVTAPVTIPETRRFGMLAAATELAAAVENYGVAPWYGPAFD